MLKKSMGVALLCMAGQAYSADITVTTTQDIVNDDTECSLREAIEYVNRGLQKDGYMGCGGENSTNNILLKEKERYVLDAHLLIKASVSIKAISNDDGTLKEEDRVLGLNNAHIHMQGKDNIFRIMSPDDQLILVNLKELDLEGCGQTTCADQGGLIYNQGSLVIDYSKLFKGHANLGGAIYNVGRYGNNYQSRIELRNSLVEQNKAGQGGILFSQTPVYSLLQNVFKNNETTQSGASNIHSVPQADATTTQLLSARISNSTFFQNKGSVINVVDGVSVNNVTIVDNSDYALRIQAKTARAIVANSIILANGTTDCVLDSDTKAIIQNNVVTASCGTGDSIYPNKIWTESQVIASTTGSEGQCQNLNENKDAILCPYITPKNSFLGYLRPRILLKYNAIEDSPILNQGKSILALSGIVECESFDQRGVARLSDNTFCDRGSIEITVPTSGILVGQDISIGEVAQFSVADTLGDSDLIPKEQCQALVGEHPQGEAWQDGCMQIVQTKTESKGKTTIDLEGNVVYTPNSAWHGADIFEIQLITSSTRFNKTKPYLAITTQIVQEPKNNFEDKEVKTSGGAWGFAGLFGLLGLVGLRRVLKD